VNGKSIERPSAVAIYPGNVPDFADAAAEQGMVVVNIGRKIEGRTKRQVSLLPESD
jgi:hypothetical protein